jgi:hypothetical protein
MSTMIGVFTTSREAEDAITRLTSSGFDRADIRLSQQTVPHKATWGDLVKDPAFWTGLATGASMAPSGPAGILAGFLGGAAVAS